MKKIIFILLAFMFLARPVSAQDNSELFIDDVLTLASQFAQPAADGAPYQASAGWFSAAEALEKWHFRVSIHGNVLFVPEEQKSFNLQNSDLELLEMEGSSSAQLPTAFGGSTPVFFAGDITFVNPLTGATETQNVRFKGFDGINIDQIPHAFAQVSFGVSAGTEITVRAMPETTIDGVTASTVGGGIKHSLSQYFGYNRQQAFQLAAGLAYSKLTVEYGYEPIEVQQFLTMNSIAVDADLWLAEIIGSKRWGFFEIFGAAGAMNSNFHYEMGGDGSALGLVNEQMDLLEGGQTQFKGDLGFNLHFGRLRLSTMATVGDYFNANVGLHVRI